MKKLSLLLTCCSFMIVISTGVAFADTDGSKVDFSGVYRAWATSETDRDYDSDTDDDRNYFSQQMRINADYTVNDNVSAHLRMDYSDGVWGRDFNDYAGWASTKEDNEIDVDRAYISLNQGIFSATVGQHWSGSANYILWDSQTTGVTIDVKLPVVVTLHYSKMDEKDSEIDESDFEGQDTRDIDFYATNLGYSSDAFGVNLTLAMRSDDSADDKSPWAVGLQATSQFGPVGLNCEVDQFGGSDKSDGDKDVVGTQLFLDANIAQNDALSYGLRFLYAPGTDDTENEVQYQQINAGAESFTPFGTEGAMLYWPYPQGYAIGYKLFFDPAGASAGVMGFNPYISYKINTVTLYGKVAHLTVQQDDNTNLDSQLIGLVQTDWAMPWFPGATLSAAYIYDQPSYDDSTADDPHSSLIGQLAVNF